MIMLYNHKCIGTMEKAGLISISTQELQSLYNKFGDTMFDQVFEGFTKLKKGGILYRCDKNYRKNGCWHDNVMALWNHI